MFHKEGYFSVLFSYLHDLLEFAVY